MAKKKSKPKSKKSRAKSKPAKKKTAKRAAAKTKPAKAKKSKKSKKPVKAAARKPAKKTAGAKKQTVGEGSYEGTRAFDKAQADFVKRNKAKIPALGKEAEAALEGPEGDSLREAEATAADRSRDTF